MIKRGSDPTLVKRGKCKERKTVGSPWKPRAMLGFLLLDSPPLLTPTKRIKIRGRTCMHDITCQRIFYSSLCPYNTGKSRGLACLRWPLFLRFSSHSPLSSTASFLQLMPHPPATRCQLPTLEARNIRASFCSVPCGARRSVANQTFELGNAVCVILQVFTLLSHAPNQWPGDEMEARS